MSDIPIIDEVAGGGYVSTYKNQQGQVIKKVFHDNKMSFLPKDYEAPKASGNYLKLTEGTHRFRVLDNAIVGWEYWNKENKPVRQKEEFEEIPNDIAEGRNPKFFWAFPVWNVDEKKVQILELTQGKIQDIILALTQDVDYGDPQGYDIVITRTGKGFGDTKYSVIAKPPVPISDEVKKAYEKTNINLEKLFTGEDPFEK